MELVQLTVQARTETGKGPARRMRAEGAVPGVVYGLHRETLHLAVSRQDLDRVYSGTDTNVLIDLEVPGEEKQASVAAMVQEVQRDPVSREPLSVDFQWVSLTEQIEVEVPLEITGNAPGVDEDGGVVQQQFHAIPVTCLPTEIPESITVDITGMQIADALFVSDLPEIQGISYVSESDEVVLTIAPPISEEDLEARIDDELLGSLVDLEVGEEVVEAEALAPEGEEVEAPEGAQVDVQEIDDDEDVLS
ncbi:MAG: 50S ribosomal protein L25 [Armatimonadota bacterium]|jgi:large subunit ribosomal protein L25